MTLPHLNQSSKDLFAPANLGTILQSNHLQHLIEELKKRLTSDSLKKTSILVETSSIKNYLKTELGSFAGVDFVEPAQFDPFLRYRIDKELADVFHLYAKFGGDALENWLKIPSLEADTYRQHVRRSVPVRAFELHIFHPTYLPKWYLDALLRHSPKVKYFFYILSPSPFFLMDLVQEKHLLSDALERVYVEDQFRLLANLIPYKLSLFKTLEKYALDSIDLFQEPLGNSSLQKLKRNLFSQRAEPIDPDASLNVIPSLNPLDEVKNCFTHLYTLLDCNPNLIPSDITIFADLKKYGPLLELVFADKLALQIDQVPLIRFDPEVKQFYRLFQLIDGPWNLRTLKSLFFSEELADWLEHVGFHSGFHPAHQKSSCGVKEELGKSFVECFEQLIDRMVFAENGLLPPFPLSLGLSLLETYDRLESLYKETVFLKNFQAPLDAWLERLRDFFLNHLNVSPSHDFFKEWANYQPLVTQEECDFSFLRQIFYDLFESLKGPLLLNEGDRIRASNLKEGAILPNKILFVLGMGIEDFPGYRHLSMLYRLEKYPPPQGMVDRYKFLEVLLAAEERLLFSYSTKAPSTLLEEIFRPV
ncbi:MAG: exodeoxyribonuclease V subunit gamma [Chlamydiia bacterium]